MCNTKEHTHFQQWIRDTHFCQTNLRHPKRYTLFEHDLLHNGWCSLYALLPERKSIKFCKFWYQIRTFDKTCSYAPLLVNPRNIDQQKGQVPKMTVYGWCKMETSYLHRRQSWGLGVMKPLDFIVGGSGGSGVPLNIITSYNLQECEMKALSKVVTFHK